MLYEHGINIFSVGVLQTCRSDQSDGIHHYHPDFFGHAWSRGRGNVTDSVGHEIWNGSDVTCEWRWKRTRFRLEIEQGIFIKIGNYNFFVIIAVAQEM